MESVTSETSLPVQVVCDEDGRGRLILTGVIDIYLADDLRRCALDLLKLGRDISVDLAGVDSMDACGMQILLALRSDLESHGGRLAVSSASANAMTQPSFLATHKVVAIGASTGGTEAIKDVLVPLPAGFPGIVIVPTYTRSFHCKVRGSPQRSLQDSRKRGPRRRSHSPGIRPYRARWPANGSCS